MGPVHTDDLYNALNSMRKKGFYDPMVPSLSVKLSHKQASKGCLRILSPDVPLRDSLVLIAENCLMHSLWTMVSFPGQATVSVQYLL